MSEKVTVVVWVLESLAGAGGVQAAFVGTRHSPEIGLDRAERVIRRFRRGGRGQGVEQGGFADIRQSDDAATKTHTFGLSFKTPRYRLVGLHRAAQNGAPPRS